MEIDNVVYILLEYAPNHTLFFYIHPTKGVPERLALRMLYQTTVALKYLHSIGIVHRDIKPENLLLDEGFNIKLCDFGWSAYLDDATQRRNSICGTYEYMSPEILDNRGHDFKTDIWQLGILMYEMIYGKPPHRAKSVNFMKGLVNSKVISWDSRISPLTESLMKQLLQPDENLRCSIDDILSHRVFHVHRKDIFEKISEEDFKVMRDNFKYNTRGPLFHLLEASEQPYNNYSFPEHGSSSSGPSPLKASEPKRAPAVAAQEEPHKVFRLDASKFVVSSKTKIEWPDSQSLLQSLSANSQPPSQPASQPPSQVFLPKSQTYTNLFTPAPLPSRNVYSDSIRSQNCNNSFPETQRPVEQRISESHNFRTLGGIHSSSYYPISSVSFTQSTTLDQSKPTFSRPTANISTNSIQNPAQNPFRKSEAIEVVTEEMNYSDPPAFKPTQSLFNNKTLFNGTSTLLNTSRLNTKRNGPPKESDYAPATLLNARRPELYDPVQVVSFRKNPTQETWNMPSREHTQQVDSSAFLRNKSMSNLSNGEDRVRREDKYRNSQISKMDEIALGTLSSSNIVRPKDAKLSETLLKMRNDIIDSSLKREPKSSNLSQWQTHSCEKKLSSKISVEAVENLTATGTGTFEQFIEKVNRSKSSLNY